MGAGERTQNRVERWGIAAGLAAATIGALLYNVLPLYLGTLADSKHLSVEQMGMVGSAFFLGFNLAGFTAFRWIRKVSWRSAALGAVPAALLAYLGAVYAEGYGMVLVVTTAVGAALGIFYTIGTTAIGDTRNPERWYGAKVALESTAGIVLFIVLPITLIPTYGFAGTVIGMMATTVLLMPLLFCLPGQVVTPNDSAANAGAGDNAGPAVDIRRLFSAVLALLVFFAGNSAIWTFVERIGTLSQHGAARIGVVLAAATFLGVLGSLSVAAIGSRIAAVRVFAGCGGMVLAALLLLGHHVEFAAYAAGTCLFMAGWAAGVPVAFAEIARLDTDGRYIAFAVPALGIGSMIGPAVAGALFQAVSPLAVLVFCGLAMIGAVLLMLFAARWTPDATHRHLAGRPSSG